MSELGHTIGIDLGTTNSVVAVVENDQPTVLLNSEGSTRTPSVVAFGEDPTKPPIVGELAKRQAVMSPDRTITSVKRLIGRSLAELQPWQRELPYALVEQEGRLLIKIGNVGFTPSQISAFILQKLKKTAEDYYGEPVDKAVITVPAYFDDLQRQATYEAAELAGLQVLRLLNEPTAAAIAYGLGRDREERVAVYDFGGGTFDLTILDIAKNTFEVLTSVGDTRLGGDDIDALIFERLLENLREKMGGDYQPDPLVAQRLREAAEKAKCELSYSRQAVVSLPFLAYVGTEPMHLEVTLRRAELEAMIRPLIERTLQCCEQALEACRLRPQDIDRVILVGGSTRIPAVEHAVEDFFGIAPFKGINPDEIVAIGAAMQAAILQGQLREVVLLDVTPHSLGVEIENGKVSRVVERNSTIPIKAAKLFTTTEDNQEVVVVHVVQGESENVKECRSLGKFLLSGIQKAKAGIPRIQVTFHINADGMVEVSAQDLATQQAAGITVAVAPSADEPVRTQRRKPSTKRYAAEKQETVGATIPAEATGTGRQIRVERQPVASVAFSASGTSTAHTSQPLPLTPRLEEGAQKAGPGYKVVEPPTVLEHFSLAMPSNIPCSPHTRAVLEKLWLAPLWEKSVADNDLMRASAELERVTKASPDKAGVWCWRAYLLLLTSQPEDAHLAIFQWTHSQAPDRLQALTFIDLIEQRFGTSARLVAAKGRLLAEQMQYHQAWDLLLPWAHGPGLAPEICELVIGLEPHLESLPPQPSHKLLLAKAYLELEKYEQAIKLADPLTNVAEVAPTAAWVVLTSLWKKGERHQAWQKLREAPQSNELKEVAYQLACECKRKNETNLAQEIFTWLSQLTPPYRDAAERVAGLKQQATSSSRERGSAEPSSDLALIAAAFSDSRFVILEEINRGSMGVIYRARDKVLDEIVALKVLNDYLAAEPTALERFKREARAAKRLSHPNIVRIHDMYEVGPKKLLSMEYIKGRDVKALLREKGTFSCEEVVNIALGVCEALAYAHQQHIVHRDIKPANIMITESGTVKVTDFGIAKITTAGADVTRSGSQIIGTPLYMAPEQIKGGDIDARADIYSLGVTMYEMISGRPPFLEGNIEYHHLHTPPPPLQVPTPLELAEIILKCLAKNPADRFQSAEELRDALANVDCAGL
ncbi:MAG: molecular chaperone DnaK [Candidatus Sumerlaeaceae bacterium]|nr:molecular chaperone DnaK [Candidatus Sumerlaeaceae bacterium]